MYMCLLGSSANVSQQVFGGQSGPEAEADNTSQLSKTIKSSDHLSN